MEIKLPKAENINLVLDKSTKPKRSKPDDRVAQLEKKIDALELILTNVLNTVNHKFHLVAFEQKSYREVQNMLLTNLNQIAKFIEIPNSIELPKPH